MSVTFDRGDLSNLTSIYSLIEPYSKEELKDKQHLALLLSKDEYKFLIALDERGSVIGYLSYLENRKFLWLDFIRVLPKYENQGYGTILLNVLKSEAKKRKIGLVVEINSPDGDDYEDELEVQDWFLARDLVMLDVPYKLASEFGDTKACLLLYPSPKLSKLKGRHLERIIEYSLKELHSDIFTLEDTIDYLKDIIPNGEIYYNKRG